MDRHANPHQLPAAYDIYGTNFYDGSLYVGAGFLLLLGLALLSVAIRWIRADTSSARPRDALRLLIVALVLLVIGWGDVWRGIVSVLPFLGVERFPWRFLAIALGLLNVLLVKELFFWSKRNGLWSLGILLALVPVLVSSYQRNQLYVTIATSRDAPYEGPVLDVALGKLRDFGYSLEAGKLGELEVRAALDRVEIEPPREEDTRVLVSWLAVGFRGVNHVPSFNFENAEIAGSADNRLLLRAMDPTRPILVSAKQYGLWPLTIFALAGYGLLISLLSWRWKRPV